MYCFSQFCRLCVRKDRNLVNLYCTDEDLMMYSDKIRCLIPEIVFEEDSIPNFICDECCNHIKILYDFKKMCLKNTEILKLYACKLLSMKESSSEVNLKNEINLLEKILKAIDCNIDFSIVLIKNESDCKETTNFTKESKRETQIIENNESRNIHLLDNDEEKTKITAMNYKHEPEERIGLDSSNEIDEKLKVQMDFEEKPKSETLDAEDLPMCLENKKSSLKSENEQNEDLDSNNETRSSSQEVSVIKKHFNNFVEPDLKLECTEEDETWSDGEDQGDESMDCDERDDVISVNDSENDIADEDMINNPQPMNLTARALSNPSISNLDSSSGSLPPFLSSGNRGKTRTNDKYRMVYTEHQRLELEKEFLLSRFIADRRRAELAISLCLTVRQIKIWFQNRRAKERKEAKRTDPLPESSQSSSPKIFTKIAPKSTSSSIENLTKRRPSLEITSTTVRSNKPVENSTQQLNTLQQEELIRKQQEFYFQQQILQQHQEILVQEQLLRQRKDFLNQQQHLLQKDFHQQLFPHQQEILRQEEYIRQQKQYFSQQQQLMRQQNILPESLLQASMLNNQMILNQPMLLGNQTSLLTNQAVLMPNILIPNSVNIPQSRPVEVIDLVKRKHDNINTQSKQKTPFPSGVNKELLPNLEELYKRKQELLKRNAEKDFLCKK